MGNHSFAKINTFSAAQQMFVQKDLTSIFEAGSTRKLARGTYVYVPEEAADKIFLIKQGRIRIGTYGQGRREVTKNIFTAGTIFGESALVSNNTRHNFAYAMESTTLAVLSVREFQDQLRKHPSLSQQVLELIGNRLIATEQRLESMVFKNSRSRIIEFLHQLGVQQGQRVGYEMLVRNFLTHQEIANLTATSRQTVTTILNELRNANILTFNRKRLLIRNMEKLAAWAE
jgi:CRP-like cAMP-binding protein